MKQNVPFVITISRQLGSGGASIGQELAKRLNMHYADSEIIQKTAKELSVLENDLNNREERVQSFWESFFSLSSFVPEVYTRSLHKRFPTEVDLFLTESRIIEKLAYEHSSIIIGRCSFHVLRNHPNHFSIYLHADKSIRRRRIQHGYEISEHQADEIIIRNDRERGEYINNFTGKDWSDARLYDLTLNTGKIPVNKCADIIMEYIKAILPAFQN